MENLMSNAVAVSPAAVPVVQNDTANALPAVAANKPLFQVLSQLETERITWEEGVYRTSNQALYALLAKCLAIAEADTPELAKQRNAELEAFYKLRGYTYKKDAPPATRVVKAVFGAVDRRRLSTYSLVLREAIKQKVLATQLGDWIEQQGGIQAVRLSQSATFIKPAAKIEMARRAFDTLPELGTVQSEALSMLADGDFIGECCVLVSEQAANGSFVVRGFTRAGGAVNAAFAALYAEQRKAA
jgi:hypothetical protein